MRFLIFILLFTLTINKSTACLSADQNRMFPIGISPKGLVVVEIHLYRGDSTDGNTERLHPMWGGLSYLNTYNKNYKLIT